MNKARMLLNNWSVEKKTDSIKILAEQDFVSPIISFDFNERVAESKDSVYDLGSMNPAWARFLEEEGVLISSFDFRE